MSETWQAAESGFSESLTRRRFLGESAAFLAGAAGAGTALLSEGKKLAGAAALPAKDRAPRKSTPFLAGASAGTFLLRIGFSGLALFVPTGTTNPTVFVLLPRTDDLPPKQQHHALLRTALGVVRLSSVSSIEGAPFGSNAWADGTLPEVPDLNRFPIGAEKVGVPAELLAGAIDAASPLQARIKMNAGCVIGFRRGAKWKAVGGHKFGAHLTTFVLWGMHIRGTSILLSTLTGDPHAEGELLPSEQGIVDACVTNEPDDESERHFSEYRRIVHGFDGSYPNQFSGKPGCLQSRKCRYIDAAKLPAFAYPPKCKAPGDITQGDFTTCMLAQAQVI